MSNFAYISGDPDNLTGGAAANMVDIQGPFVDLATWLNTDLQPRVAAAVPSFVTSLPVGATDGQEIYYQADAANGVIWHLRYNASSASSYKWEYVGGSFLRSEIITLESTSSTAYADLTTVGPTLTVPLGGDYVIALGANIIQGATAGFAAASFTVGATVADDNDSIMLGAPGGAASAQGSLARERLKAGIAASTAIKMQYRSDTATSRSFRWRYLAIRPVRVG